MINKNNEALTYQDDVQKIKSAVLQSRYRSAAIANAETLNLYYSVGKYISANTHAGKWETGAIETIVEKLQGELSWLKGFSPSSMKNMRIFYEQWSPVLEPNQQPTAAELEDVDADDELILKKLLRATKVGEAKVLAFCKVGFTHHREILRTCKTTEERWHYILRCADEFWSVADLINHLRSNDYASYDSKARHASSISASPVESQDSVAAPKVAAEVRVAAPAPEPAKPAGAVLDQMSIDAIVQRMLHGG